MCVCVYIYIYIHTHTLYIRKRSVLELRRNLSKDAYTTTIYLSEMNFIKTTQKILRNSGK